MITIAPFIYQLCKSIRSGSQQICIIELTLDVQLRCICHVFSGVQQTILCGISIDLIGAGFEEMCIYGVCIQVFATGFFGIPVGLMGAGFEEWVCINYE